MGFPLVEPEEVADVARAVARSCTTGVNRGG